MSDEALEFFGKTIMSEIRDPSIDYWEAMINGHMKGDRSRQVQNLLMDFEPEQIRTLLALLPLIVDSTIFYLLWMLEQKKSITVTIKLQEVLTNDIANDSDGLAGELSGWASLYSQHDYTP